MQDIHDIKPPVEVGIDPAVVKFIIAVVAVLLCLIAGYFLFGYIKKRLSKKRNNNIMLLPPPPPADEAALKELANIADLMMTEPRLYYFRLTALVKTFIGKMFDINAPEMTTQEIITAINTLTIDRTTAKERTTKESNIAIPLAKCGIERCMIAPIREFFLSSSMVKYAAMIPQIEQMKSDEQFIKQFINSVANSSPMSKESPENINLTENFSTGGQK
ncbi:MAG: hypothetical protein HQK70_08555 [Desulfamplus sp.]|nr:hypothetical protein [Desulfamplus sp.]